MEYQFTVKEDGRAVFVINRAHKKNAINYEVMKGLKDAITACKENDDVKVLLITGAGQDAFCSGGDVQLFHALKTEEEAYSMLYPMGGILYELMTLPKPTIAVINGIALGGGCELASACDIRIAVDSAKIGFIQGRLGITTGWGGTTILQEKLSPQSALHMLYSASTFSAEEGKEYGFIQRVVSASALEESMKQLLEPLLQKSASVLRQYKTLYTKRWEANGLFARMQEEIQGCAVLWAGEEHHQAVESFLQRK
ncbi:enoyl-CoA hydratase/isomerase family protein [Priestia koreensis]|nr:enoyl-CoA hydratase/isomerase family protein [Priestia koreensis]